MNGDQIYQGFLDRGYNPTQAAALTGNILQESGGNPQSLNAKEGANGLLQWRLDRWQGLQDFAKTRGTSPYDANTQMDFIGTELGGPEKRSAAPFFAAPDVTSANTALKGYIRYGDDSQGTRLANAQAFLPNGGATAPAPMSIAGPQPAAGSAAPAPAAPQPTAKEIAAAASAATAPAAPSGGSYDANALAAVPKLANILPARPNPFGLPLAPFSFRG
jgi:hypothetical protein